LGLREVDGGFRRGEGSVPQKSVMDGRYTSEAVAAMHAARNFSGGIQSGDDDGVHIEHLLTGRGPREFVYPLQRRGIMSDREIAPIKRHAPPDHQTTEPNQKVKIDRMSERETVVELPFREGE
jgi:hypothetical protein